MYLHPSFTAAASESAIASQGPAHEIDSATCFSEHVGHSPAKSPLSFPSSSIRRVQPARRASDREVAVASQQVQKILSFLALIAGSFALHFPPCPTYTDSPSPGVRFFQPHSTAPARDTCSALHSEHVTTSRTISPCGGNTFL